MENEVNLDLVACMWGMLHNCIVTETSGQNEAVAAIILAAGKSTRMGLDTPKVALEVAGKPLVAHVADTLTAAGIVEIIAVVSEWTKPYLQQMNRGFTYACQPEPLGTGDATKCGLDKVRESTQTVVVACGDSPLFTAQTVRRLLDEHRQSGAVVTLTSCELDAPSGYGRIVRNDDGDIVGIVEEKRASVAERAIREVNGGLYAFECSWLREAVQSADYHDKEFVLTEVLDLAARQGRRLTAIPVSSLEIGGVNTPGELEKAERLLSIERIHRDGRTDS